MRVRSWFAASLCLLIACGVLASPSAAARKVPRRPVIVKPRPVVAPPPVIVRPAPPPIEGPVAPRPVPPRPAAALNSPQFGVSVGHLAGLTGAVGEIRFHNPLEFKSTSLRLGAGYVQGNDSAGTARKHALVILDGIYRMTEPDAEGLRSYFGAGVNYDAYTSGRVSGTFGGEVFYGVEANAGGGQMYGEIGYGLIRTGFSPNQQGLNLQVGYKI
ncbi:MAG: hypothetical protein QME05_04270 [Candidatus Margulisbacteria bacterium]|nr:hypothetical protein [Candidatus Margulisiibacteriota bacterium]